MDKPISDPKLDPQLATALRASQVEDMQKAVRSMATFKMGAICVTVLQQFAQDNDQGTEVCLNIAVGTAIKNGGSLDDLIFKLKRKWIEISEAKLSEEKKASRLVSAAGAPLSVVEPVTQELASEAIAPADTEEPPSTPTSPASTPAPSKVALT
jgi:hypothetical protein